MDNILESAIERAVCQYAQKKGWLTPKSELMGNGWPDRLLFKSGCVFFIEFKRKDEKPGTDQLVVCNTIIYQGGLIVYVIDNIKDGKALIDAYEKELCSEPETN